MRTSIPGRLDHLPEFESTGPEHFRPAVMPMARLCPRELPPHFVDGPDADDPTFWQEVGVVLQAVSTAEVDQLQADALRRCGETDGAA